MKQRVINGNSLEFYNSDNSKKGEIKISGSDVIINPIDSSGTVIFGEEGTINDIEVGASGTPVDFTFLGGGTITPNGGTLTLGESGDTIDLSNATIGTITASIFKGGQFIGDGSGLTNTPSTFTNITASGNISASGQVKAQSFELDYQQSVIGVNSLGNDVVFLRIDSGQFGAVNGSSNIARALQTGNTNGWQIGSSNAGITGKQSTDTIIITSDGNNVLTITGSKAGIGTTAPSKELTVAGDISASGNLYIKSDNIYLGDNETRIRSYSSYLGLFASGGSAKPLKAGSLTITNDFDDSAPTNGLFVKGDATIQGTLTAQEFKTEFISASIVFSSGSTKFGDTLDDVHNMTGSLLVTGSQTIIGGDDTFTIQSAPAGTTLTSFRTINAGGNEQLAISKDSNKHTDVFLKKDGTTKILLGTYWPTVINNENYTTRGGLVLGPDLGTNVGDAKNHNRYGIYVSAGPDSGSAYFAEHVTFNSHITASGNISASGNLTVATGSFSKDIIVTDIGATRGIRRDNAAYDLRLMGGVSNTDGGFISLGGDIRGGLGNALAGKVEIGQGGNSYANRAAISSSIVFNAVSNAGTSTDMTIVGSTGNVGIGTTSPSTKLHVVGGSSGYLFRVTGTNTFNVYDPGTSEIGIGAGSSQKLKLYANDSLNTGITIATDGKVGIGTTSPDTRLHVSSSSGFSIKTERAIQDGGRDGYSHSYTAGGAHIFGYPLILEKALRLTPSSPSATTKTYRFLNDSSILKLQLEVGGGTQDSNILSVSSSNIGIGTASPNSTYKLTVAGKSYLSGGIQMNSGDEIDFGNSNQYITGVNDTSLTLATGGSATLTATHAGNVGIGTTAPPEKLTVEGNISASGNVEATSFTGSFSGTITGDATGLTGTPDITVGNITASGNISSSGMGTFAQVRIGESTTTNYGLIVDYPDTRLLQLKRGGSVKFKVIADNADGQVDIYDNSGNSDIRFLADGDSYITNNLGIGTTSPAEKLTVAGNISASGTGSFNSIAIPGNSTDYYIGGSGGGAATNTLRIGSKTTANTIAMELFHATNPVSLGVSYSGGDALAFIDSVHSSFDSVLQFKTGGSERFRIGALNATTFEIKPASSGNDIQITDDSGNAILYSDTSTQRIGIGITSPSEKLQVTGNISASGNLYLSSGSSNIGGTVVAPQGILARSGSGFEEFHPIWGVSHQYPSTDFGITYYEGSPDAIVFSGVNIGIGTTSPSRPLHVKNTSAQTVAMFDAGANGAAEIAFSGSGTSGGTYVTVGAVGNDLSLSAGAAEKIRVKSDGKVGIGIDSPSAKLHLSGSDSAAESSIRQSRAGRAIWDQAIDSSGRLQWGYRAAGSEGGTRTVTFTLDDNNRVAMGFGHAPDKLLHISGSGGDTAILLEKSDNDAIIETRTNGAGAYFRANSVGSSNYYGLELNNDTTGNWFLGSYGYADFSIVDGAKNSGTRQFTVKNTTGNVGIGTTAPPEKLTVEGNISASGNFIVNQITASGNIVLEGTAPTIRIKDTRNLNNPDWDGVSLGNIEFYSSDTTSPGARVLAEIEAFSNNAAASGPNSDLIFKTSENTDSSPQTRLTIGHDGTATFTGNIVGTLGTAAQTNITSLGTLTGLNVNGNITASGNISASGDLRIKDIYLSSVASSPGKIIGTENSGKYFRLEDGGGFGEWSSYSGFKFRNTSNTNVATLSNTGDLTIIGTLTAQEFHTEFVSASIMFTSGSTKFGNTLDDLHSFTGSVDISSSLGRVRIGNEGANAIHVFRPNNRSIIDIDATAGKSATLNISQGGTTQYLIGMPIQDVGGLGSRFAISHGGNPSFVINGNAGVGINKTIPQADFDVSGSILASGPGGHITASGNISASGAIIAGTGTYQGTAEAAKTDVGFALPENSHIYTIDNSGGYLRNLIGKDNDVIKIGQSGTSLVDEIRLQPGSTGFTSFRDGSDTEVVRVDIAGNITASGDISASGRISGLDYTIDGNLLADMAGSTIALGYQNNTPISIGRSANPINLIGQVTASGGISASGKIETNTLFIADTSDGGATIGNDQILHAGNITTIETTAANLTAGQATVATNVTAVATTDNAEFFVGVLDGASGNQVVETSTRLKYNPSSGKLTVSGDISSSGTITANVLTANAITFPQDTNITIETPDEDSGNGNGGNLTIGSGNGAGSNGNGGNVTIETGNGSGAGDGGDLTLTAGTGNPDGAIIMNSTNFNIDATGNITASGEISASGEVYSDNIETFWTSFNVDGDANFATSVYGPNTQGINYYFWNKNWTTTTGDSGNPTGDHVHRTEINTGWYVPYKIRIVELAGGLHDGGASATSDCEVGLWNTAASFKSSDLDSNTATTKEFIVSGSVTLNGNRWKHYSQTCDVVLEEGQYVLPRIRMGSNITNLRGQFTIKYKRVK